MHAAVVELDALADAVRTSPEDEDLLAVAGVRGIGVAVSLIGVRVDSG
jgi:hypothetical protein